MYCGIDPSLTGTGVVVLDSQFNILNQKLISTKPYNNCDYSTEYRMKDITTELAGVMLVPSAYVIHHVYIEGLSFNSKGQSAAQLFGLAYYIRHWLLDHDFMFKEVPPTVLKKFVAGQGRCQKDLMLLKTYKKFGVEFSDHNLCDAYGLARYGAELNRSNK